MRSTSGISAEYERTTSGTQAGITPYASHTSARAIVVLPVREVGGRPHFELLRAWNRLGALTSPLRLTAETATTSGGALLHVREVSAPGKICVVHVLPARVCSSQSQALPWPLGAQVIFSEAAPGLVPTVSCGLAGWARPSQGEGGTRAGC